MDLLDIHPTAWSIFFALKSYGDTPRKYQFSAWYNGRERAICVYRNLEDGKTLCVVFGEPRRTDGTFVDVWECTLKNYMNPPTLVDFTEEAYSNRRWFNTIDEAIRFIYDTIMFEKGV